MTGIYVPHKIPGIRHTVIFHLTFLFRKASSGGGGGGVETCGSLGAYVNTGGAEDKVGPSYDAIRQVQPKIQDRPWG